MRRVLLILGSTMMPAAAEMMPLLVSRARFGSEEGPKGDQISSATPMGHAARVVGILLLGSLLSFAQNTTPALDAAFTEEPGSFTSLGSSQGNTPALDVALEERPGGPMRWQAPPDADAE